jgi:serine/threonine protein kinase
MNESYDKTVDYFSLGVLTFFLLSGYLPFDGENEEQIASKTIDCKINFKNKKWIGISDEGVDFVNSKFLYY